MEAPADQVEAEEPVEAEESTQEDAQEDAEGPEAKPKQDKPTRERKRDIQARIDELVRDKYTSKREAADAQGYALRLQRELDALKADQFPARAEERPAPTAPPAPPQEDLSRAIEAALGPEPSSDNFDTFEAYTKAQARWSAKAERFELEAESRRANEYARRQHFEQQSRASNDAVTSAHFARIETARESIPDFDDVIAKSEDMVIPPPMRAVIMNEEAGPYLMYHLAQYPEELERIASLPPTPQLVAMGRLIAQIGSADPGVPRGTSTRAAAPKPSKLPPPPKTVGAGSAQSTVSLDDLPYDQYREIRNREERERMARR